MKEWLSRLFYWEQATEQPETETETETVPTQDEVKALNAFYYNVASGRLNSQFTHFRQIDVKTVSYFKIGSTVLPIAEGFVSSDNSQYWTVIMRCMRCLLDSDSICL
jgi:hypothetical protein